MKRYHVVAGDGKGYYGGGYESYREAESLLKISKGHDPQAHIVEEEYHFTNADRIRVMTDEKLAELIVKHIPMHSWPDAVRRIYFGYQNHNKDNPVKAWSEYLKQPAEEEE